MERLRRLFLTEHNSAPADIPRRVVEAVTSFERGAKATDDKTIVVLRRNL